MLDLLFDVARSTITRAVGQIRALLAERRCTTPDRPGVRLRTMGDVFAYARAEGVDRDWTPLRRRSAGPQDPGGSGWATAEYRSDLAPGCRTPGSRGVAGSSERSLLGFLPQPPHVLLEPKHSQDADHGDGEQGRQQRPA